MRIVRFIVTGCLLCVTVAAQQSSPPRSASSGVYSSGQAEAGEKIYFDTCANCHGADLGGVERAPALTGAAFLESWQGQDLLRLRTRIDAMPPNAPGSLSDTDAVAVMAFVLRSSGMPAGTALLPADRAQLARITFGPPRAGGNAASAPGSAPVAVPPRSAPTAPPTGARSLEWTTYGGDLASHRYSPADQITKDNFNSCLLYTLTLPTILRV